MIKRAPLSKDPAGKCNRWRVIVYNQETKKYDWHTVRGSRDDSCPRSDPVISARSSVRI